MTLSINTLLNSVRLAQYPNPHSVHIGFMKPVDIKAVADIPYFLPTTSNADIATNLTTTPVKEWQRFPCPIRIAHIKQIFASAADIMPNAVLLCENIHANPSRRVCVRSANVVSAPTLHEVTIPTVAASPNKPLWIIDGQHRVEGLAAAELDQPIPVVLLLNDQESYTGDQVAKLFAQVTTGAEPLDPLHNEWMSYAFDLGKYADPSDGPTQKLAMEAVIALCRTNTLSGGVANPFYSQVQFNLHLPVQPLFGGPVTNGFSFHCTDLQQLLYKGYFSNARPAMAPQAVAEQLGLAVKALSTLVGNPDRSVFFGGPNHEQEIVSQAFLWGVLSYLRQNNPSPLRSVSDWEQELRKLMFAPPARWEFDWTVSLAGPANTKSKKAVRDVFTSIMTNGVIPHGVTEIPSYLKGAQATIDFRFATVTPSGLGSRGAGNQHTDTVQPGNTCTLNANQSGSQHYHVKIVNPSGNIAGICITDKDAPPGTQMDLTDEFESGISLLDRKATGRLKLLIRYEFYGATFKTADVDIAW